ncbi:MAG: rRNA maturation RNase YbeY [Anaerolineae bacterium]|jgi:probable rRNA maturation factor
MNPPNPSPPPANIELQIDPAYEDLVPVQRLHQAISATLRHGDAENAEMTLVIADDLLLTQLNRQYRGIDAPTDVLSFAAHEESEGQELFVTAPEALNYLGDVIISFPTAERQAAAAGQSVAAELCLLAVHGVLHLLGYDHASPEEEADMWARQAQILASLPPHA